MTTTIGDPRALFPDGSRLEVRLFQHGVCTLVVTGDAVEECNTTESTGEIPICDVILTSIERGSFAMFRRESVVEVWSERARDERMYLVGRFRIDYLEHEHPAAGPEIIRFHGRGVASTLADSPTADSYTGDLRGLVEFLTSAEGVSVTADLPTLSVDAWVNSASKYGALLLVSASYDLIVTAWSNGALRIETVAAGRARAAQRPVATITSADVRSSKRIEGTPVDRRR